MRCNGADDWSFKFMSTRSVDGFPSADTEKVLEAHPVEMSFTTSTDKYDFARVKFSTEVGSILEQEIESNQGAFSDKTVVQVKYKGEKIHTLLFRPDWARFGYDFVTVQLKDLHKSLSSGNVNIQRNVFSIEEAYKEVLSESQQNLINGYKLSNVPEEQTREGIETSLTPLNTPSNLKQQSDYQFDFTPLETVGDTEYAFTGSDVFEGTFSVDIDNLTPEQAIQKLNNQFGLQTWIDSEGKIVIGLPEKDRQSVQHVAAPDDTRVWRYKNPQMSYNRNPIKGVFAFGTWEDAPGLGDPLEWFEEGGLADARVVGVAERTDVSSGELIKVDIDGGKKDSIESAARLQLIEETKSQNTGRIEIDPIISGNEVSHPIDIKPGDLLQLVPSDEFFVDPGKDTGKLGDPVDYPDKVCGGVVKNEAYIVNEVEHKINDNGAWKVNLELSLYPRLGDSNIKTSIRYYDPSEEEYYSQTEFNTPFDIDKSHAGLIDTLTNLVFENY
jgi:hypothetical protein